MAWKVPVLGQELIYYQAAGLNQRPQDLKRFLQ
jgi:hypothetical protein